MKCPEWILEAMRKGDGVKCLVWDGEKPEEKKLATVTGFDCDDEGSYPYATTDGNYAHAEPYTEPAYVFGPFDRVLVGGDGLCWRAATFSHKINDGAFCTSGGYWKRCIPYEGNEHLLGTTDSPKN